MEVTGLFLWKNVVRLGYLPLESYLSTRELLDDAILCVDPTSDDDTVALAEAIADKFPQSRVVHFEWPKVSSNGSAIGIASNYALSHAKTDYVLNVQADEVWPVKLVEVAKSWLPQLVMAGIEAVSFKVLHTEHSAQQLQGGGNWHWQKGAAYNRAIKFWKRCNCYRFSPDGWSIQAQGDDGQWHENNVRLQAHIVESEKWPILHLHDFYRDTVLERRRVQAEDFWSDVPHYGATYHAMRDGEGQWDGLFDDPKWLSRTSPFWEWMPECVRRHLGKTQYRIHWEDLE